MANLQTGGIELVVKGFSKFISSIGQVNKSYQTMNKGADSAAKAAQKASDKVVAANRRMEISQRAVDRNLRLERDLWDKASEAVEDYINIANRPKASDTLKANALDKASRLVERYLRASEALANAETRLGAAQDAVTAAMANKNAVMAALAARGINVATVMKVLGVAIAAVGVAVMGAVAAWNIFKRIAEAIIGVVQKVINVFVSAAKAIGNFFSRALAVTAGMALYNTINKIKEGVGNLVTEVVSAVSFFQKLRIQLESLQARDIAQETGKTIAQSFGEATGRAKELYQWIANLAVRTPFTAASISETMAMANAMGLNVGMAKQMTKATIDFTAAMGLSEDHMFRIIYNFGQMLAQGKLNGREFRDLANSFVPVWRMLENMAKGTGKTTEEFKKLAFEGGVPVEAFFKEFIRMAEEDFAGAATKMARTMEGVTNNLRDFLQLIIGASALGPTFDFIAERLAQALDSLLKPEVRKSAEMIGQALLRAFKLIRAGVDALFQSLGNLARAFGLPTMSAWKFADAITFVAILIRRGLNAITVKIMEMTNNLNTTFSQAAAKAKAWGYNFVAAFAKGMAAAINLIVIVINTLSRILSFWFKGMSPPRIAPDLDKWGAAAMTAYMKGWLNFDLSVFKDIAAKVEGFLRSIPGGIGKENTGLVPAILGSRDTIAKAINNVRDGLMTVGQAADMVFNKVGKLTKEFKDYIVALFEVEAVNKRVAESEKAVAAAQSEVEKIDQRIKAAQDEQNAITEKYTDILKELNDQLQQVTDVYDEQHRLREIDNALMKGMLTAAERERLEMEKRSLIIKGQIRDTEDERDAAVDAVQQRIDALEAEKIVAEERVKAAEAAEAAAQVELEAAQAKLDAAEALIDIQIEQNQLIQEQLDLLESLKKAAGGGAGGVDDLSDAFDDLGIGVEDTTEHMTRFEEEVQKIKDRGFQLMFERMNTAVSNFLKNLGGFDSALAPLTGPGGALTKLTDAVSNFLGVFSDSRSRFSEGFIRHNFEPEDPSLLNNIYAGLKPILDALKDFPWEKVGEAIAAVVVEFSKLANDVDWKQIGTDIGDFINKNEEIITLFAENGKFRTTIFDAFSTTWWWIKFWLALSQLDFETAFKAMIKIAENTKKTLVDQSIIPEMMKAIYDSMTITLGDILTYTRDTWVVQMTETFTGYKKDTSDEGGLIPTSMKDIYDSVTTKMGEVKTDWETKWKDIKQWVDDKFNLPDGMVNIVDTALNAIAKFFEPAGGVWNAISGFINGILNDLKVALQGILTLWDQVKGKGSGTTTDTGTGTGTGDTGRNVATGGVVKRGFAYTMAEKGREMIVPLVNSMVVPNWLTERMLAPQMAGVTNITNITNVEVNPNYSNIQSEAGIYFDVRAALAASRL